MTLMCAPSTVLSTIGCWNVMAAAAPPPQIVSFESGRRIPSKGAGMPGPCQTPQKATSFDMLPSQLNFVGSNIADLLPSSGSIVAEDANIASDSPSGAVLL